MIIERALSVKERIEAAKQEPQIPIKYLNKPNIKLMAEAAINLHNQIH